jgi:hypothetical protein
MDTLINLKLLSHIERCIDGLRTPHQDINPVTSVTCRIFTICCSILKCISLYQMIVYVHIVRLRKSVQLRSEVHKRNPFSLSLSALLESKSEQRGAPNHTHRPMIFGLLWLGTP